jgi:nucleoside-diphosphate-sugar epimerase
VARALIVGCGCRGRQLGRALLADGWAVRGTTRDPAGCPEIEAAGIEAAVADPDRAITLLELVGDVAVICWLLGSARGTPGELAAIHGPRLERLLEEIVDTPVRGVVYESAGTVPREHLEAGERALLQAEKRWRIPHRLIEADPGDPRAWSEAARVAVERVIA